MQMNNIIFKGLQISSEECFWRFKSQFALVTLRAKSRYKQTYYVRMARNSCVILHFFSFLSLSHEVSLSLCSHLFVLLLI